MKASELIEQLRRLIVEHGDLPVVKDTKVAREEHEETEINEVCFEPNPYPRGCQFKAPCFFIYGEKE